MIPKINLVIFVGVLLATAAANALLVRLSDVHTMAKRSDIVIHGYVGDQNVATDRLGRLVTYSDIEVIDGLHGAKTGEIISIYQVGGHKDGVVMPLMGGQHYSVGQEIFFFGLKMDDAFVSYGAGLGKLDVIHDGKQDVVVEDLGDVRTINNLAPHGAAIRPAPLVYPDANLFKAEVKLMLDAQ